MKVKELALAIVMCAGLSLLTSCVSSKYLIPPSDLRAKDSGPMDILMKDGTIYSLTAGDIGIGNIAGYGTKYPSDGGKEHFSGVILLSDVELIQTAKIDRAKSLLLYTTIGVLAIATMSSGSSGASLNVKITRPSGDWSCPYVFTYDGDEYHFESETFAGAVCRGMERTNIETLKYLREVDGDYRLVVANQSHESDHINELTLIVVDHPFGTDVIPDVVGGIHTVHNPISPISARSFDGRDALDQVATVDNILWESDLKNIDFSQDNQLRDGLIFEFLKPEVAANAKLVINGMNTGLGFFALEKIFSLTGPAKLSWLHQLNTDTGERARFLGWIMREGGLHIFIWEDEKWNKQGWLPDVGPLAPAEKIVPLDLTGVKGERIKIKIESVTDLWRINRVAIDYTDDERMDILSLSPRQALTESHHNVADALATTDSLYYSILPGQHASITYDAILLNPAKQRSFILKSRGYYYPWIDDGPNDNRELVKRIFEEPLLGEHLYLSEWKTVKAEYARLYDNIPKFEDEDK